MRYLIFSLFLFSCSSSNKNCEQFIVKTKSPSYKEKICIFSYKDEWCQTVYFNDSCKFYAVRDTL